MKLAIPAQNVAIQSPSSTIDPTWYGQLKSAESVLNMFAGVDPAALASGQALIWDASKKQFVPGPTAWTTYTPALSASSGVLASASASGRYSQIGKTVFVNLDISIATNGTAAGFLIAELPLPAGPAASYILTGRELNVTGNQLQGQTVPPSHLYIVNYNNTYPAGNGYRLIMTGIYETS